MPEPKRGPLNQNDLVKIVQRRSPQAGGRIYVGVWDMKVERKVRESSWVLGKTKYIFRLRLKNSMYSYIERGDFVVSRRTGGLWLSALLCFTRILLVKMSKR